MSTQQIYTIVLEIRASLLGIDTRFTYFQVPVRVEDALGRVFPFPSECSIEALNVEIKTKFKEGPGKTKVMVGDFEIFNAKNTDEVLTVSGRDVLLPGMSIHMAIILERDFAEGSKCPMPYCASKTFLEAVGGGRTWYVILAKPISLKSLHSCIPSDQQMMLYCLEFLLTLQCKAPSAKYGSMEPAKSVSEISRESKFLSTSKIWRNKIDMRLSARERDSRLFFQTCKGLRVSRVMRAERKLSTQVPRKHLLALSNVSGLTLAYRP